jgi:phospholipase/lecithinase/hemolysin
MYRRIDNGRTGVRRRALRQCGIAVAVALAFGGHLFAQRAIDLSRLVVLGDSLSAGFQNNGLLATQQVNGYAALFARQAGTPLNLPLIAPPGIPNVLVLNPDGSLSTAPGTSPGLLPNQPAPSNFAIPGARVIDTYIRNPVFGSGERLSNMILGPVTSPTEPTQVSRALALDPTTMIVWIGANDVILSALYYGTTVAITDPMAFAVHYTQMLWHLQKSGATIILANIPNILQTAAFIPLQSLATRAGVPLDVVCVALGQPLPCSGSFVTILGLPTATQLLQQFAQTQVPGMLPPYLVLTAAEAEVVRQTVEAYNATIAQLATTSGAILVDVNKLVDDLYRNGVVVNGQRLTTDFLGGLYSLDGVHPTNTGYALIANEFIRAVNTQAAISIRPVSVEQVSLSDPLVPRPAAAAASGR